MTERRPARPSASGGDRRQAADCHRRSTSTSRSSVPVSVVNAYVGSNPSTVRRILEQAGYTVEVGPTGWSAEIDMVLEFGGTDDDYERQAHDTTGGAGIVEAAGEHVGVKHSYYEVVGLTGGREALTFR